MPAKLSQRGKILVFLVGVLSLANLVKPLTKNASANLEFYGKDPVSTISNAFEPLREHIPRYAVVAFDSDVDTKPSDYQIAQYVLAPAIVTEDFSSPWLVYFSPNRGDAPQRLRSHYVLSQTFPNGVSLYVNTDK